VVGAPAIDPTTGSVWVVARAADGSTRDVELAPLVPVTRAMLTPREARPKRNAPAWVQTAASEYREAREAWCHAFEAATHQTWEPGLVGREARRATRGGRREVTDFLESHPPPAYRDFLRDHAARQRGAA
jgi:hypothetical protein